MPLPATCSSSNICWQLIVQTLLIALTKFFSNLNLGILTLWQTELYPCTVRTIGIGYSWAVGVFGSFIVPYLNQISFLLGINPLYILSLSSFVCFIVIFFLKETIK